MMLWGQDPCVLPDSLEDPRLLPWTGSGQSPGIDLGGTAPGFSSAAAIAAPPCCSLPSVAQPELGRG
ncbi:hypothetical protein ACRRTK_016170 [Alexandromys fortis]